MANFPIQYARELPTGRAAVAPARLDVRTGAEEEARAVSGFGAALFESGRRIADAQKAMEFSTFKRREEEFRLGALQALRVPGFDVNDDEAVAALKEKTNADRDALISKWQSVNDIYQMYRNEKDPQFDIDFEGEVQNIKARNVKDEFNLNAENLLAAAAAPEVSEEQRNAKMLEYLTLLEISLATDVISKAEYDFRTKSAPNDSILQQMRIQIGNNNPQGAIALSEQMTDPTADQMEYRDRLLARAGRDNVERQEADRAVINRTLFVDMNYDIFDLVEASTLDEKEKLSFYKLARTLAAAPPEGYKDNPVVMAKILPLIARGELTEPQIRNYVGKGLSPETAESIIKGDVFWRDYWFKESDDFLKRNLGWSSRDEVFMHPEGSVAYDAALRELRTIVLTEGLKGREVIEKARDIGLPYLTDYWKEVLVLEETRILKMTEMIRGKKVMEIPIEEEPELKPSVTLDDIWGK